MLLIATKIVPKNALLTLTMLANFLELLLKESRHISRQSILKTFWPLQRPNKIILRIVIRLRSGWKVSSVVSTSELLL